MCKFHEFDWDCSLVGRTNPCVEYCQFELQKKPRCKTFDSLEKKNNLSQIIDWTTCPYRYWFQNVSNPLMKLGFNLLWSLIFPWGLGKFRARKLGGEGPPFSCIQDGFVYWGTPKFDGFIEIHRCFSHVFSIKTATNLGYIGVPYFSDKSILPNTVTPPPADGANSWPPVQETHLQATSVQKVLKGWAIRDEKK